MSNNATMAPSEEDLEESDGGTVLLGAALCVFAAFIMANSMTIQRFALAYPEETIPLCARRGGKKSCCRLKRMQLWGVGLVVYGLANGFYTIGLNYAPLSMCGAIFATVLVFNLVFARFILGEELTRSKIAGCLLVLVGVVICALSAPTSAGQFNAADIEAFAQAPTGWGYFAVLIVTLSAMMVKVWRFEKTIPFAEAASVDVSKHAGLIKLMDFVLPCSLGIQEGLCQLGLKGWVTMLFLALGGSDDLQHPAFWYDSAVTVFFCCLALYWLQLVYRRCETSKGLPIEYGTVTMVAVCSGIIFFQEYRLMSVQQLLVMAGGLAVLSVGIGLCSSSTSKTDESSPLAEEAPKEHAKSEAAAKSHAAEQHDADAKRHVAEQQDAFKFALGNTYGFVPKIGSKADETSASPEPPKTPMDAPSAASSSLDVEKVSHTPFPAPPPVMSLDGPPQNTDQVSPDVTFGVTKDRQGDVQIGMPASSQLTERVVPKISMAAVNAENLKADTSIVDTTQDTKHEKELASLLDFTNRNASNLPASHKNDSGVPPAHTCSLLAFARLPDLRWAACFTDPCHCPASVGANRISDDVDDAMDRTTYRIH